MGYSRAGFDVVGVDIEPQPRYPFEFHQADALEYLAAHGHEFDAIHASPPCQKYQRLNKKYHAIHADLIAPTRQALASVGVPYVIENVPDARRLLRDPLMLCGTMFGLNVWRHRLFETEVPIWFRPSCQHVGHPVLISGVTRIAGQKRRENSHAERAGAMGVDWMTTAGMDEAIPPAYTEFIGAYLLQALKVQA